MLLVDMLLRWLVPWQTRYYKVQQSINFFYVELYPLILCMVLSSLSILLHALAFFPKLFAMAFQFHVSTSFINRYSQ